MTQANKDDMQYAGELLSELEEAGFVVGPHFAQAVARHAAGAESYLEFFRSPEVSAGVLQLAAGQEDTQQPHTEDEVYLVIHGRGEIQVGLDSQPIAPGSVVVVGDGVRHYFHSLTEDLTALVVFRPAEGTNS